VSFKKSRKIVWKIKTWQHRYKIITKIITKMRYVRLAHRLSDTNFSDLAHRLSDKEFSDQSFTTGRLINRELWAHRFGDNCFNWR
jgi:hypothetical protein